jgi:acyl-coenzyme A thioesterase PaaI-like protein
MYKTTKTESFNTKLKRWAFNFFPAYRRTGGRITFIAHDYTEVHIKLGLNWTTRNYVGTVFGGSMFGATDPIFMVQLYNILGAKNYIIWDIEGNIKFLKPIKKVAFARFLISPELIETIKKETLANPKYIFTMETKLEDAEGNVYAEIERKVYVKNKNYGIN